MDSVLRGVRVLELSYAFNGPLAGRILAELGAEVIKIEPPWGSARDWLPIVKGESGHFVFLNANKKFITLNLKTDEGKEIFKRLVKVSDVVLFNFTPGTMEKLGLGYEEMRKIKEDIIYVSSSGFGYTGPYKDLPAYDYIMQAMVGIMGVTGFEDRPLRTGPAIIDAVAGIFAALGTLAALYYKKITGKGQMVDIAMFDVGFYIMIQNIAGVYFEGRYSLFNKRLGNKYAIAAPYSVYRAKDGYVCIGAANDRQFQRLCEAMGKEYLMNDPRFKTNKDRVNNMDEIDKIVEEWTMNKSKREIIDMLRKLDVPVGEVREPYDNLEDPQVKEREMMVKVKHPVLGEIDIMGSPLKMSETPGKIREPGYPIGFHNEEIYCNLLKYNKGEIEKLKAKGVI